MGHVGDGFHEGLAGVHDLVGDDGEGDAEAQDHGARQYHEQAHRINLDGEEGDQPHAEVGEPAEEEGEGDLQELDGLEVPAEEQNLPQDEDAVPENEPAAQGQVGELVAQDVGHRGDGGDTQLPPFGQRYAQGGEEQADDQQAVAFGDFFLIHWDLPSFLSCCPVPGSAVPAAGSVLPG